MSVVPVSTATELPAVSEIEVPWIERLSMGMRQYCELSGTET
jgi:hypothetical protein